MMIVYGQGEGANLYLPAAVLVSYSAPVAAIVMADVTPLEFLYVYPTAY